MEHNSFVLPLLFIKQMSKTAAHTDMLVCQGTAFSRSRYQEENSADEDEDTLERPGMGNATVGSKALHARHIDAGTYNDIRFLDPDVEPFKKYCTSIATNLINYLIWFVASRKRRWK